MQIERESFAQPHWTIEDFLGSRTVVAEVGVEIVGFIVSRETFAGDAETPPEREILNLAVTASQRRQGIAAALLKQELSRRADFFLEVRESSLGAQALYRKFGFTEVGRRPNYYQSPSESAIVMKMKWC